MNARTEEIRRLRRRRSRSGFVRVSLVAILVLVGGSWALLLSGSPETGAMDRSERFGRFLDKVRPFPLKDREFDWGETAAWAGKLWKEKGLEATGTTLAISLAAIVLAALLAAPLCLLGARTLATAEPFLPGARPPPAIARGMWFVASRLVRSLFILVRAIPEYVWAFLLVQTVGPTAWAAVLALAIHNMGILGRLSAETVENLSPRVPSTLRGLGAGRMQIVGAVAYPTLLPRFLLYFFYRWETCVRVATVLGILGIASLGYRIDGARHARFYDEMMFYVLLGAALVIVGDAVSAVARGFVRRAT